MEYIIIPCQQTGLFLNNTDSKTKFPLPSLNKKWVTHALFSKINKKIIAI
jgi:hypothetical protein